MSRGFDGPEIDDFQRPERNVNRSPESNSRSGWDTVRRLERIRGEEERADQRDQEARGASGGNRPPLPREEPVTRMVTDMVMCVFHVPVTLPAEKRLLKVHQDLCALPLHLHA